MLISVHIVKPRKKQASRQNVTDSPSIENRLGDWSKGILSELEQPIGV
jgi:hypothetical protein